MSEYLGRKVLASIDGTSFVNGRTKNLTIDNTLINVSADGDDGIQRFLDDIGEKSVSLTIDGLAIGETLLDKALSSSVSTAVILTFPAEAGAVAFTLTGTFMMSNTSLGMPYNEATTISASFSSSGVVAKAVV